jgi:huntingtin interacting protein 1
VNGNGKLEEIIVCSNEIAASTAQLVVASNVKADRESKNRKALMEAKTNVSSATGELVASAKSFSQIVDDESKL